MGDLDGDDAILGLGPGAAPDEVKQAYRDLVRVWHPDRFPNDPRLQAKASEKLREINHAFERLQARGFGPGTVESVRAPRPEPPTPSQGQTHRANDPLDDAHRAIREAVERNLVDPTLLPEREATIYDLKRVLDVFTRSSSRSRRLLPDRPGRRRRAFAKDLARDRMWVFEYVNRVRAEVVASAPKELGELVSLEALDAICYATLVWWARSPARACRELPSEGLWTIALIGALHAFATKPPQSTTRLEDVREEVLERHEDDPGSLFVRWWSEQTALDGLAPRLQGLVASAMELFRHVPDARERIRRCQTTRCDRFFLDSSPTYRMNPAKGCSPAHRRQGRRQRAPRAAEGVLQPGAPGPDLPRRQRREPLVAGQSTKRKRHRSTFALS